MLCFPPAARATAAQLARAVAAGVIAATVWSATGPGPAAPTVSASVFAAAASPAGAHRATPALATGAGSAQGTLLAVAQRIGRHDHDAPEPDACIRVERRIDLRGAMLVVTSSRWIHGDGSGRITEARTWRPTPTDTDPAADWAPSPRPAGAAMQVTVYGPGGLPSPVGDPVPASADLLATRVEERAGPVTGAGMAVAILVDLAGVRSLGTAQRAAVLRVLARLPGLSLTGASADPVGRPGIGFAVNDGTIQAAFIIDAADGRLLSYAVPARVGPATVTLLDSRPCADTLDTPGGPLLHLAAGWSSSADMGGGETR